MKTKKQKSGNKQSKLMTAALKTVDTIVISHSILFAALYQIKELSWLSFPIQLAGLVVSPKVKKYTKNWFILITVLRKSFQKAEQTAHSLENLWKKWLPDEEFDPKEHHAISQFFIKSQRESEWGPSFMA